MTAIFVRVFAGHPIARRQLTRLLSSEADFRLVRGDHASQVGIFDSEIPSLDAVLTLSRNKFPSMRPLLLCSSRDEGECLRWILRDVWGLLSYDSYEEELCQAVRSLAGGQPWYPASVIMRRMRIDSRVQHPAFAASLTERENEVMGFLLRRLSNKEISSILGISLRTVKFHVGNILAKLQLNSRVELLAYPVNDLVHPKRPGRAVPVPFPVPRFS